MLATVRDKTTKKFLYAIMICDRCKKPCEESKCEGPKVRQAEIATLLIARKTPGWTEVATPPKNPRVRRYSALIELLCPDCTAAHEHAKGE